MDRTITTLPTVAPGDPLERALSEVDVAIALVMRGLAVTVTLSCLEAAERAAFAGAASAQAAHVGFRLERQPPAPVRVVIGPRLSPEPAPIDAG
jgi:hypothetical protein